MAARLKLIRRINFAVAGGISSVYLYGKVMNAENMKQTLELKVENKPVPVPGSIKNLLEEVRSEIKEEKVRNSKYEVFISQGVDITQLGIPDFYGVQFGLPYSFLFDKDRDIDLNVVMDENKPLTNETEVETLKNSMCLSKDAKKFALAHEMYKSHHSAIYSCGILPLIVAGNFNFLSYFIEKWSIKQGKPVALKSHLIIFMLGAWFYALYYDMLSVYRDSDSDYLASQLGSSYIRGGIEYYEKMIERNKILKKVQKSSHFTEDGDVKTSFFRTNRMPLLRRLAFLREYESGNLNPGQKLFMARFPKEGRKEGLILPPGEDVKSLKKLPSEIPCVLNVQDQL